jgi:hypothetical protein
MSTFRNNAPTTAPRTTASRLLRSGLALAAVALAACQDGASAPAAPGSALRAEGPRLTLATSSVTTTWLNPTVDNVYVSAEGHRLYIPANSICRVGASGYGPTTWDLPCATATSAIALTITSSTDASGHPRIDVKPDVRFSPSKTATVSFVDAVAAAKHNSFIGYCPSFGACIDESLADGSLRTTVDPVTKRVARRIKHFSGYTVIVGVDGEWMQDRAALSARASGYITTTGLDGGDVVLPEVVRNQ